MFAWQPIVLWILHFTNTFIAIILHTEKWSALLGNGAKSLLIDSRFGNSCGNQITCIIQGTIDNEVHMISAKSKAWSIGLFQYQMHQRKT